MKSLLKMTFFFPLFIVYSCLAKESVEQNPKTDADKKVQTSSEAVAEHFQKLKQQLLNQFFQDDWSKDFGDVQKELEQFFKQNKNFFNDSINRFGIQSEPFSQDHFTSLNSDLFEGKWEDSTDKDKKGRSFIVTPLKDVALNLSVKNGMISINSESKSSSDKTARIKQVRIQQSGYYSFSMNVPEELDWAKHSISQKGKQIVLFFPYRKGIGDGLRKEPSVKFNNHLPQDEKMEPVFEGSEEDVI